MPILFVGQEIDAYDCVSPYWGHAFSRKAYHSGGFKIDSTNETIHCGKPFGPQENVWAHFVVTTQYDGTNSTVYSPFRFYNSAGQEVVRASKQGTDTPLTIHCWDGSSLTPIGKATQALPTVVTDVDFHFDCVNNKLRIFSNGTLIFDESMPSGVTDIASFSVHAYSQFTGPTNAMFLYESIIATEPTIGYMVATKRPGGNGAYGDFQGSYTDVNAALLGSGILSETDGDISTFTKTAFTFAPSGYEAKAVVVSAKASRTPSPESEAALVLRHGGNNYESPYQDLATTSKTIQHVWDTDPANSAQWNLGLTIGTDMQFGIKSKIPA